MSVRARHHVIHFRPTKMENASAHMDTQSGMRLRTMKSAAGTITSGSIPMTDLIAFAEPDVLAADVRIGTLRLLIYLRRRGRTINAEGALLRQDGFELPFG